MSIDKLIAVRVRLRRNGYYAVEYRKKSRIPGLSTTWLGYCPDYPTKKEAIKVAESLLDAARNRLKTVSIVFEESVDTIDFSFVC